MKIIEHIESAVGIVEGHNYLGPLTLALVARIAGRHALKFLEAANGFR